MILRIWSVDVDVVVKECFFWLIVVLGSSLVLV